MTVGSVYYRAMSAVTSDVTAFILAGGKSTRMGTDKAFVMLDGSTLLERMLELARSVCADVRIVGDSAKFSKFGPVVEDIFPGCGPLAGIHAALRSSQTDLNLIVAIDTPFLSVEFLEFLITKSRCGVMVTVPRTSNGWQPLCAVYRHEFADLAEKCLHGHIRRIDGLFYPATTLAIDEDELSKHGFSPDLFRNLNTPEELDRANNKA